MSDEMTLEKLEETVREEKESVLLLKLDPDFFVSVSDYMEKLVENKDFFCEKKLQVVRLYVEEIVEMRMDKILAQKAGNVLSEEHKLIKLSEKIKAKKAEIKAELLSPAADVEIRVKKPIPQFMGPNMKNYGPYEVGQTVCLSKKIVSLLAKHDYVEKVSPI